MRRIYGAQAPVLGVDAARYGTVDAGHFDAVARARNIDEVIVPYVTFTLDENARIAASELRAETIKQSAHGGENTPLIGAMVNAINPYYDEEEELMAAMHNANLEEVPQYMSLHEREAHMPLYDSTFGDYNELVIQFGPSTRPK